MNINIITTEPIKNTPYEQAIAEYQKRLSAFTDIVMTSDSTDVTDHNSYHIQIVPYGSTISSEELASEIQSIMLSGYSSITYHFDSYYNTEHNLCISNMKLSNALSVCTLHEQIYRAFMIINNRTYHK